MDRTPLRKKAEMHTSSINFMKIIIRQFKITIYSVYSRTSILRHLFSNENTNRLPPISMLTLYLHVYRTYCIVHIVITVSMISIDNIIMPFCYCRINTQRFPNIFQFQMHPLKLLAKKLQIHLQKNLKQLQHKKDQYCNYWICGLLNDATKPVY